MRLKYLLVPLLAITIAGGYYFYQVSNQSTTTIISPLAENNEAPEMVFSIETAPSESLRGTIATMSGEIKWQSRTATEAATITAPIAIQQGEKLITAEGSTLSLVFDQATLALAANSELEVIQTLPGHIVFAQTNGTVRYINSGKDPVSIRTKHLLVETSGNLLMAIDPEKPIITLTLKSGSARVAYNDLNYVSQILDMEAEQTLTFNDETRRAVLE